MLGLHGYLLATRGQTIGKWLFGLRVVRHDGQAAPFTRLILRDAPLCILGTIAEDNPLAPVVWGLLTLDVLLIFGSRRQCLHDRFAQTQVIRLAAPPADSAADDRELPRAV